MSSQNKTAGRIASSVWRTRLATALPGWIIPAPASRFDQLIRRLTRPGLQSGLRIR